MKNLTIFKLELITPTVATCHNRVTKRTQHVAPNNLAICWVEMLQSFGLGSESARWSASETIRQEESGEGRQISLLATLLLAPVLAGLLSALMLQVHCVKVVL